MAGFSDISGAIRLAKASNATLFCGYCGTETMVVGRAGVCSNCEMPIEQDARAFSEKNPELSAVLGTIRVAVRKGDFDTAAKAYDDAFAKYKDPGFLYAESLVRIRHSNATIAQIRYDRKGFMEENTAYRNKGAQLTSSAKLLLAKAISVCNNSLAAGLTPGNAYLLFLCYNKMGKARAAGSTIGLIEKTGSIYLSRYAKMAHDAAVRDYKALMKDAEAMLAKDSFSVNAFFYLALSALKNGDEGRALRIIDGTRQFAANGSMGSLAADVKRFEESLL